MVRLALALLFLSAPALAEIPGRTLEIIATPTAAAIVEGEMIPVTIRGVYDTKVTLEEMTIEPGDSFDWLQLQKDDWHEERIDGKSFIVVERRLALFPKHSGFSRFGPAQHKLTFVGSGGAAQIIKARPLELSIAPLPDDPPFHNPHGWRFAAADLSITDELSTDPATLEDGQTVTRRVTLRAVGALPEMLPPRPVVSQNWLITFAAPVERKLQLTPDGPIATVVWTWQFRPETGEPGVLPPVPIPFFNTVTRRVEAVEIAALPIGYASFAASQAPGGEVTAANRWGVLGAVVAGLVTGLAALVAGHSAAAQAAQQLWRHYSPVPGWRLRRAVRQGDLLVLRRAASDYARDDGAHPELFHPLDEAIYAPSPPAFDGRSFVLALRQGLRLRRPRL